MNPYGLIIPTILVVIFVIVAYFKDGFKGVGNGLGEGGKLFITVLPNLLIGFTLAGFLTLLLPQEIVAKWLGKEAGLKGIGVGWLVGALTPGGPFTHFPILASLIGKGAAIGPVSAYIASWSLIGIHRMLIWEAPILGWRFVIARVTASLFFPFIIGVITQKMAELLKA